MFVFIVFLFFTCVRLRRKAPHKNEDIRDIARKKPRVTVNENRASKPPGHGFMAKFKSKAIQ